MANELPHQEKGMLQLRTGDGHVQWTGAVSAGTQPGEPAIHSMLQMEHHQRGEPVPGHPDHPDLSRIS